MGKKLDLTGRRFGRLAVIESVGKRDRSGSVFWLCKCDCGNTVEVRSSSLISGHSKSCGCIQREITSARCGLDNANYKHGLSHERLHNIWTSMKSRCFRETATNYKFYGGRGIAVCEEWRNSFETFRDWALANGYRDDLTIDRIDNDGNYCPENCRWVEWEIQRRNQRKNKHFKEKGVG